ncbi:hypothetical protein EBI_27540 [Enterocytozoon bieneusi H348]|nr:hypothetical protein EBI_27540 [Enterocytozoon bieneusi H348]|eukprot:XP_002650484.1 hypothetical protein EBI_27540 [Enterocytozoon bieneusi H348]
MPKAQSRTSGVAIFSYGRTPLIQHRSVDDSPRRYTSSSEEALQLCQPFRHQVCIIVAHGFGTTIFQARTLEQSGQSVGFGSLKFGIHRLPSSWIVGSYDQIWAIAHVGSSALSWRRGVSLMDRRTGPNGQNFGAKTTRLLADDVPDDPCKTKARVALGISMRHINLMLLQCFQDSIFHHL